ncbi:MAG: putative N-acetylmannosamine-6-phosphate 2-epimerase [Alphaproteobacteria bacterium]|nr:putative N-acetylmannosamine-6-phosphate 2-epimerase [Alphaproteobacteria bacterium]
MASLRGGLIASCQPVPGGAFDRPDLVAAFARAVADGGAKGLRIEGLANVAAVAAASALPIIGLIKRDLRDSAVRITPHRDDVTALAAAGARIVAFDATRRARPAPVAELVAAAHAAGALAMADCAALADAQDALAAGADILGTTLSGYVGPDPVPALPDLDLVRAMSGLPRPVFAEGRLNTPALAGEAMRAGAFAVVVGSAITRPEHVARWFADAVAAASAPDGPVLGIDIGGSKILVGLVEGARVESVARIETPRMAGAEAWLDAVAHAVAPLRGRYRIAAAAVSGIVRDGCWSAANPATLPVPDGFPLEAALGARLGCRVRAYNDAQAAAWGEWRFGAGAARDMVFVTISSGIGGGIVLDGRLLVGATGLAGSLGQSLLAAADDSGAERLEDRAAGLGLARRAAAAGRDGDAVSIWRASQAGEAWAVALVDEGLAALARALATLKAIVDPAVIVVGGGLGLAPGYLAALAARLDRQAPLYRLELRPAALGAAAGLVGAADLARGAG